MAAHRVRIPETGHFIYNTLFKDGVGADVRVTANEREWHLHRHYLNQVCFLTLEFEYLQSLF